MGLVMGNNEFYLEEMMMVPKVCILIAREADLWTDWERGKLGACWEL